MNEITANILQLNNEIVEINSEVVVFHELAEDTIEYVDIPKNIDIELIDADQNDTNNT